MEHIMEKMLNYDFGQEHKLQLPPITCTFLNIYVPYTVLILKDLYARMWKYITYENNVYIFLWSFHI
jgi:hypothetical protein